MSDRSRLRWTCCTVLVLLLAAPAQAGADEAPLRDPMRPFEAPQRAAEPGRAAPAAFEVSAVLISAARRVAVVNGQVRGEGDAVDGAVVERIEPRRVALRRGDEEIVLRLPAPAGRLRITSGDGSR